MGLDWEAQGVLADFRECQRASQNTDLVFHCTNGNVSAHQMIFAGISPFFTGLMQRFVIGQELFPLDLNISLPEIRREHVEMVVEMVYTGQVPITKRDYQPFREICQLLQLSVPIADYDNFFMHKGSKADKSNSFDALDAQEQVAIPLKSPTVPRVFVCDECYAMFPLKIGLKRHKKSQHDKIESEAPNPQQSPTVTEPSTVESTVEPQLNARLTRQRSLNGSKSLVCLQNDERLVECPDCQSLFGPRQVRQHLAVHLKEELRALLTRSKSGSGVFKCQESLCSYETAVPCYMSRHLGVTHDFITKFANEAQMKFLHDAEELIFKPRSSSLKPPCNSSPEKIKKNLNQPRTSQHILENEDGPEKNNDVEPEIECAREDSIVSESQSFKELDEVNRPMLAPLDQPSSSSLNGTIPKSVQIADRAIECPDCQSLIHPSNVKYHLISHLRKELNEFIKKSESKPEVFECQLCSHESSRRGNIQSHVGVTHDKLSKVTNAAQKKFLQECQDIINKPWKKRRLYNLRTRNRIQENEEFPENGDNNVEIEDNNGLQDATDNESLPKKDEHALECPDCQSLIQPSQVKFHMINHLQKELNEFLKKSESKPKVFKCQFCSHETSERSNMLRHVGVTHDALSKFTNVAQKKFIQDGQDIISNPYRKRELFNLRTRNRIQENEVSSKNGENNVEIEDNNGVQEASKNESQPKKDDHALECPDCQSLIHPSQVKYHMINHLVKKLNEFLKKSESKPEVFECQFCSYETAFSLSMRRHVGVTHDKMSKFTNAAQKKFIQDGQDIISNPYRKKELSILRTRNRIQKKEDSLQVGDNNGEIQGNNGVQDATNSESPAKKDERALECPDCRRLIHPLKVRHHLKGHMRKKLGKHTTKSDTVCGLFKCQLCSFESTSISNVYYHVGVKHKMMMKYANAAQKKFMDDAQRMLLRSTKSEKLKKSGQSVICPDCLKSYPPREARRHLVSHLQEHINEHLTSSETMPQVFKCKLCPFEAPIPNKVRHHLGLNHNMLSTYANPTQKKFLQDARKLY